MSLKIKLTLVIMMVVLVLIMAFFGYFTVRSITLFSALFAIGIMAAAAVITFLFVRNMVKSIIGVTLALKDIAEGEGDLNQRMVIRSKDEAGDLSRCFNLALDKLKTLFDELKIEATALSRISNDLAYNMNYTALAMNEIAANFQSAKGCVINPSVNQTQTSSR